MSNKPTGLLWNVRPKKDATLRWWQFLKRRRAQNQKRFDAAVAKESALRVATMFEQMIGTAIEALPVKFSKKIERLANENHRLRQERDDLQKQRWVHILVALPGTAREGQEEMVFVLTEYNTITGETRAPENEKLRHYLYGKRASVYWRNYPNGAELRPSSFNAPRWEALRDGSQSYVVFGKVYTRAPAGYYAYFNG